jgi:hypothetical protein
VDSGDGVRWQAGDMSATTPADLAVTFRSLARRQREAVGDADPGALAGLVAELDGHVAAAAAALGTSGDAEAVARAIDARHADEWDDATLATLRDEGLAAGAVLRRLAAAAEDAQR